MSYSFLKYWAMLATAFALVLLGILLGRGMYGGSTNSAAISQSSMSNTATGRRTGDAPATSSQPGGEVESDAYAVPEAFSVMVSEWRTRADGVFTGYAIRFDPPRREVIIEQCEHPGYFNSELNKPVPEGQAFCNLVLWGQLQQLSETSALALDRKGRPVELSLDLSGSGKKQELTLRFDQHDMTLVAGSKNDLFQAMEQMPEIKKQKQMMFAFQESEYQELRKKQQQMSAAEAEVPRYTLPDDLRRDESELKETDN